jgi:hypothetical protein
VAIICLLSPCYCLALYLVLSRVPNQSRNDLDWCCFFLTKHHHHHAGAKRNSLADIVTWNHHLMHTLPLPSYGCFLFELSFNVTRGTFLFVSRISTWKRLLGSGTVSESRNISPACTLVTYSTLCGIVWVCEQPLGTFLCPLQCQFTISTLYHMLEVELKVFTSECAYIHIVFGSFFLWKTTWIYLQLLWWWSFY